ncbi:MAG: hypothetical protein P0S93_05820, partial [Candidatus Neptunochlamydia sp.]|nr:hypothetical protein [Candidatus Neptunochlamydia sp.]
KSKQAGMESFNGFELRGTSSHCPECGKKKKGNTEDSGNVEIVVLKVIEMLLGALNKYVPATFCKKIAAPNDCMGVNQPLVGVAPSDGSFLCISLDTHPLVFRGLRVSHRL